MPIDTSIYGLINKPQPIQAGPMPFEQAGQMMQLRHLMNQGQLHDLQRGELERGIAEKGKLRDLFSRGNVKPEEVMAIDPATGMTFQKNLLESQNSEADLAKKRAETIAKNMGILRDLAAQANDDAGFKVLKETTFKLFGAEQAARIPDRFDPEVQKRMVMTADQLLERLSPKLDMRDTGSAIQGVHPYTAAPVGSPIAKSATPGEVLTDARARSEGAANRAVTTQGQNLIDARERDVRLHGDIAAAREQGKDIVNARQQLPQAIANAERGVRLIDEMVGSADGKTKPHPGMQSAVGVSLSKLVSPFWAPPGTDRRDFDARLAEIKGGAFLQAFESLKGGGAITELEGKAATQAITRMESAQSEREFVKAAREFQKIVQDGMSRARLKAGENPMSPGGSSVMAPKPAAGAGIKFLGFE